MATFTDRHGRTHTLTLTVGKLKPLRDLGFDLNTLLKSGPGMGDLLAAEPEKLVSALTALCDPPADPDQFADGLDGAALESAVVALLEETADFFPWSRTANVKGRIREALRRMAGGSNDSPTNSPAAAG